MQAGVWRSVPDFTQTTPACRGAEHRKQTASDRNSSAIALRFTSSDPSGIPGQVNTLLPMPVFVALIWITRQAGRCEHFVAASMF